MYTVSKYLMAVLYYFSLIIIFCLWLHLQTSLTFELTYNAPDGSVGMWQRGGFEPIKSDELRGILTEEEQNQLNIDRQSIHSSMKEGGGETAGDAIDGDEDQESLHSSNSKSLLGSRLSISSKTSGGKSPKT